MIQSVLTKISLLLLLFAITPEVAASKGDTTAGKVFMVLPAADTYAGEFQLGLRSTASLFGSDGYFGSGVGGQFRIGLGSRINTEWFADLITSNLGNAGRRTDGHIGWSVMFYLKKERTMGFNPYILAGHCFDYTKITAFSSPYSNLEEESGERWSSAVQMGAGTHYRLTPRFDVSLSAQYMLHLGNDIHAHVETDSYPTLEIEEHEGAGLEGHLLVTFSVNYKIGDLWGHSKF